MPSSIAVQSSLPSSHAARRALRGLENTTPSLFSPSKLKVRTYKRTPMASLAYQAAGLRIYSVAWINAEAMLRIEHARAWGCYARPFRARRCSCCSIRSRCISL